MREFPARLPHQPIFYPVVNLEYATQIARDWNTKDGSLAGYVTDVEVADSFLSAFEPHTEGSALHKEYRIPAERLPDFNSALRAIIRVHSAYFGHGFRGLVPDKGALAGKTVLCQFTKMAELLRQDRRDLVEEVNLNRKAVFLNFLFCVQFDLATLGMKEELRLEVLGAIRQIWQSNVTEIPLPINL